MRETVMRCVYGMWILLVAVAAAEAAEPLQVMSVEPASDWDAHFQRSGDWIGADGNYAIRVAPDRVLWFFSDTLLGRVEAGRRVDSRMINNSIGVQTETPTGPHLEFYHGIDEARKPVALFRPDTPTHWYWLLGGTIIEGRVHLFLWEFQKSTDPGVFGFQNVGVTHAIIENPLELPTQWKVSRQPLPFAEITEERRTLFGSTVMKHGGFVYVYGTRETPHVKLSPRQMLLARAPEQAIHDHSTWEFRTESGWSTDVHRAAPLMSGISAEYSVHLQTSENRFLVISHGDLLSPQIVARTAEYPWGPWTAPVDLWKCPEPASRKGYFAYAGKAHPEISADGELLITYAVNSFQFADLFQDATLYWPRFVRVKLVPKK